MLANSNLVIQLQSTFKRHNYLDPEVSKPNTKAPASESPASQKNKTKPGSCLCVHVTYVQYMYWFFVKLTFISDPDPSCSDPDKLMN